MTHLRSNILAALLSVVASTQITSAASPDAGSKKDAIAFHQKMAEMHTKMADCLKSDKPAATCKDEMRSTMRQLMKDHPRMADHDEMGCGMMDHHGRHHGPESDE